MKKLPREIKLLKSILIFWCEAVQVGTFFITLPVLEEEF